MGIKSCESVQYYCLEIKEKKWMGMSPGQNEHVLNSPIKKTLIELMVACH